MSASESRYRPVNEAAARYLAERLVYDFPEFLNEAHARAVDEIASRPFDAPVEPGELEAMRERIRERLMKALAEGERDDGI